MSHVNDILLAEGYNDHQVQRIAAQNGHMADHWVDPSQKEVWPILKTQGKEVALHGGGGFSIPSPHTPRASQEYELHEPEKAQPGDRTFAARGSLKAGGNTRVTVHEYNGHHYYLWREENPRQSTVTAGYNASKNRFTTSKHSPYSLGTQDSIRLYGPKEGFKSLGVVNPVRVHPEEPKQLAPQLQGGRLTEPPPGVTIRKIPTGVGGKVKPKKS
jgi:hypothetical protein